MERERALIQNYQDETDETLMYAFSKGDDAAFDELVRRYQNKLVNFICKKTGDYEKSEEVTQEVFIRVYRARDRYQVSAKFATFIFRIALNLAYNVVRDRNRQKTDVKDDFSQIKDHLTPDRIYERQELRDILFSAIDELAEKYRDVVYLCDVEKFSYKDAGEILNISMGTVQSRLSRGRLKLREKLSKILDIKR
jgi:RNA polymerase sigma-70 factor, ECF subfamily